MSRVCRIFVLDCKNYIEEDDSNNLTLIEIYSAEGIEGVISLLDENE